MSLPQLTADYADTFPELVSQATPAPTPEPRLVVLNHDHAQELGLDPAWLATPEGIDFLLGHQLPDSTRPVAQAYAGHQFGSFVPLLGDGRAILTGELTVAGRLVDVHLKGSGPTPFSRPGSDGYAALGPMLREYLVSEAVHALGIPTTRALAVISTGRNIRRETQLPGAVLVRTGPSHLRVGTFQYVRTRNDLDLLQRLTRYSLARHYPDVTTENPGLALLTQVVEAQAELIAAWMHAGMIHGVMNTDNMTIAGHSIDFGPVAFLDAFDPSAVYSSIDHTGRYAYGNQPIIAEWNLSRFAEALLPVIMWPDAQQVMSQDAAVEAATTAVAAFRESYSQAWTAQTTRRLGLSTVGHPENIGTEFFAALQHSGADFPSTVAGLAQVATSGLIPLDAPETLRTWYTDWLDLDPDVTEVQAKNPVVVPRNHLVEAAIEHAVNDGDLTAFTRLLHAVTEPWTPREGITDLQQPPSETFAAHYQTFCGT